jgi:hypothetical protein
VGKKSFTVVLKDAGSVKGMVAEIKKGAAANDIEFSGDEKKGTAKRAGAVITYVVTGTNVKIDIEDSLRTRIAGWDAARLEKEVRSWIQPYIK